MYRALEMLQLTAAFRQQGTVRAAEPQCSQAERWAAVGPLWPTAWSWVVCLDGGDSDGKMSSLDFLIKGLVSLVSQFSDYKPGIQTDEKQY